MAKLLKIIGRTIGITFEWILFLIILLAFLIRTSSFQTFLGTVVTDYLSSELNTEMRIGKIDIVFINRVLLKDVYVEDLDKDTLASVETIDVRLQTLSLPGNRVVISSVLIDQGRIGINKNAKTGDFNFDFIADYFSSNKPKSATSDAMAVEIKELNLKNIDLSYDDNRKPKLAYGLDYDHLHFKHVNLSIGNFSSDEGAIGFNMNSFSAREQSGLVLKQLKLKVAINPKNGVLLKNITIQTPTTSIYASHFDLRVKSFDDFSHFNSKVRFDASIDSSSVDLKDVSYFVPALEGMDQIVRLSSKLTRPLNDLHLTDLDLRFGKRSIVRGDFVLPDFSLENKAKLSEQLEYCYVDFDDLKALHLPKSAGTKQIELEPMIDQLEFVELRDVKVDGEMKQFVMSAQRIGTGLGNVRLNNGIKFTELKEGGYAFTKTVNSNYDVYIDSFQLGKFISQDIFGSVTGSAFLTGVVGQKDVIRITELSGDFQKFGFNQYGYSNIKVYDGSFIDNVFKSQIDITDPHLAMHFDGSVDVNKIQKFDFDLKITKADLGVLNLGSPGSTVLADIDIDLKGTNIDDYSGKIIVNTLVYTQDEKTIGVPQLDLTINRGAKSDNIVLVSDVLDMNFDGKVTSGNLVAVLNNSFAEILPTFIKPMALTKRNAATEFFQADITLKNTQEILELYAPDLHIAYGTKINVAYNSQTDLQTLDLKSDEIAIIPQQKDSAKAPQKQFFRNLHVKESLQKGNLQASITADRAAYNDSLYVDSFQVNVAGQESAFNTKVLWNQGKADPASFEFDTEFKPDNEISGLVKPSYFSVRGQKWEIKQPAEYDIAVSDQRIFIDKLLLERETQSIRLDGVLSNKEEDVINLDIKGLHVEEFSKIFDPSLDVTGVLYAHASLRTPFTLPQAEGNIDLTNFYMNKTEIGNIGVSQVTWNPVKEALIINGGSLTYNTVATDEPALGFSGSFYPMREKDNYGLQIKFNGTDLKFANAFVDPEVVSNIKGNLKGSLKVRGETASPEISGEVNLNGAGAKIGILGTTYEMSGKLKFDGKNDVISAILPVYDEVGNVAVADLQISHADFANFDINLDFWFNNEYVSGVYHKPFTGKFMVLNTQYKEGDIYYGTAFASGYANLAIHNDLTEIDVHAKTEEGTVVSLPMYGASDISDFDFIEFYDPNKKDSASNVRNTGLELGLNLEVTNQARVNLIFNPITGDAIEAYGNAPDLEIDVHQNGSVNMSGEYKFARSPEGKRGGYDIVLPPIKTRFDLIEGGSISWTNTPYDANMNLAVVKTVTADLNTLEQDENGTGVSRRRKVDCLMYVKGKLSKPDITVDVKLQEPAVGSERALVSRATGTVEDEQKQWFNLLAFSSFAPINGGSGVSSGTALEMGGQTVNDFLKKSGAKDLGFESGSGGSKLTVEKQLGSNVIVKGSGGVAVEGDGENSSSSLMGDMSVDVLLNDDGSFRLTIFNQPNGNNPLNSSENGEYTQGIGLSYSEEFDKTKDSRLIKAVKDPFNKKGSRKKRKKKKVPTSTYVNPQTIKKDDEEVEEPTPVENKE
jgi:hypothetical protein